MSDIYNMKLHDIILIKDKYINIIRVAGGWIYESFSTENGPNLTSVFVPFDNEFQEANDE